MLKNIPFYSSLCGRELFNGEKAGSSHVLVYGAIEAHSMGPEGCIASDATIAEETYLKEATVTKVISHLKKAGWIDSELTNMNKRIRIIPLLEISALPPSKASSGALPSSNPELYSPVKIDNRNRIQIKEIDKSISKKVEVKFSEVDIELCQLLFELMSKNYPNIKEKPLRNLDYETINKLNRIDGHEYQTIEFIIRWSQQDEFWRRNIRSAIKLRKQFNNLMVQAQEDFNKRQRSQIVKL